MRSRTVTAFRFVSLALMSAFVLAAGAARADGDDPAKGNFTLADATKGLAGPKDGALTAKIETTLGTFTCELFDKKSPITVANFVGLARGTRPWKDPKSGNWETKKPFFDGLIFHRVIPNFMIQGGDPQGTGMGNPGYKFVNENDPSLLFDKPGLLAMANAGPNTNGSQFFITEAPQPSLNGGYTIFGQCDPVSLVGQIARVEKNGSKPVKDVVMKKVTITRGKAPKADKKAAKADAKPAKADADKK
ncbi:MAG TPA: peptidylprolyl isomerase [Polyangia bacterium]|jgi:peptidyl-prolyl cis-trans isomerase A (cyclophilin A)|nr:peptidylprolyl isomerase [Polyangia bacterium]